MSTKDSTTSKDRTKELQAKLDELANSIVTDPDKLKDFVQAWVAGYHQYSLNNWLLARIQKTDCSLLTGFNDWKKRGRHVKKGQKAIWVLAPASFQKESTLLDDNGDPVMERVQYFISVPVFDVSQTEGKPIEDLGCTDLIKPANVDFKAIAALAPVPVEMQGPSTANGWTDGKKIVISEQGHETSRVATLFHEWAHVELKHAGMAADSDNLPRDIKELEAEAVSYLVCSFVGIDNQKSALYLGNWQADKDKLNKSGVKILRVAEKIIRAISKAGGQK